MIPTENVTKQQNPTNSVVKPRLVLFSTDSVLLEKLKPFSAALPYISYDLGNGPQVTAKARLDALWATLMTGVEVFGATPPFPLHEASVLQTPPAQLKRGMPRYGIVGVALSRDEGSTPEQNVRLVMSALLKAVHGFNSEGKDQITRVGILPDDLEFKKLEPTVVFKIIREVYEAR
jgi:hypothetical protein